MTAQSSLKQLSEQLGHCMAAEQVSLKKRLNGLKQRVKQGQPIDQGLVKLARAIEQSVALKAQRLDNLPQPEYPTGLPVCERRDEIKQAIAENQVVIVAGETGSGKTTQLPKICLELGRGVGALIGHTQPRRLAARTLAARIASELKSEVGKTVGYKVRFSDHVSPQSYIKIMTDGILLAEMQHDRGLNQYDTLIIDEAHERSLNIDFMLGYLKQLLPQRPDLKVIITSATIDTERFSKHFNDAPVVEVSGKTYPVEVRYRPLWDANDEQGGDKDITQGIVEAVDELARLDRHGDILVFLPGEREIRETAEALRKHHPQHVEILPLYARLSATEQARVFQLSNRQRIVLATNVAETSLTVPGIRYVVDPGLARISRYSYRSKVQRLPIEKVSQASANQRAGRCGRVAAGVCIRLYSEEDFEQRSPYTEPEIHRTNLASVILQMKTLGLGEVAAFPFIDPPDSRMINDGYKLLQELGAVDAKRSVTELGRRLARLPIDPRIGRMVLAAEHEGAVSEVLVIAAALSIQEPRERPVEYRQAADENHQLFHDEQSDFLAYFNLWNWYQQQKRHLTHNKLRKLCKQQFVSYLRMREWEDIYKQLHGQVREMSIQDNDQPAGYDQVHRALLTGLLGNLGLKEETQEYVGARSKKLHIFPGSSLYKKPPKWIMAAELVETTQLFARTVAKIEPEWVEQVAAGQCHRSYSEPHWEKRRAQVVAFEKLTLYGLPIVPRRKVHYGPIDHPLSRELFIRGALVQGEFNTRLKFFARNQQVIADIENLESKARRRDVLVDDEVIFQFYDGQIPEGIYQGGSFERWYKTAAKQQPDLLNISAEDLMRHGAESVTEERYPDVFNYQGVQLPLHYHFDLNHRADGITVEVPLAMLNQLQPQPFEWLVLGFLKKKIIFLIKSLPKSIRRNFVPAPDFAEACMEALEADRSGDFLDRLAHQLTRLSGELLSASVWEDIAYPDYLNINFQVIDAKGKVVGSDRDLTALKSRLGDVAEQGFTRIQAQQWGVQHLTDWNFGELPDVVELQQQGLTVKGYPALEDCQDSVSLVLLDAKEKAKASTYNGLLRLFSLRVPDKIKYLKKNLPNIKKLCLLHTALGDCQQLIEDIITAALVGSYLQDGADAIRTPQQFNQCLEQGTANLIGHANEITKLVEEVLSLHHEIRLRLKGNIPPFWLPAVSDLNQQLSQLFPERFLKKVDYARLQHYPRYLKAIQLRLGKLDHNLDRDRKATTLVAQAQNKYQQLCDKFSKSGKHASELDKLRWMIEELRISLFAQEIKTAFAISPERITKFAQTLR